MAIIYIVSDGTGRTAKHALEAAMLQFGGIEFDNQVEIYAGVRTFQQIDEIVENAALRKALIVHTLVDEKVRHHMQKASRMHVVETVDLMGPLLLKLTEHLNRRPEGKPGLYHEVNEEYFKRIDAVQFAFAHDDGQRIHELAKAEIVLVGVSRTFKTPISIYLAFKGWLVANVPLVVGIAPPTELFNLPPHKVFGLFNNPLDLSRLRKTRQDYLNGYTGDYASLDFVRKDLEFAHQIFRKNPGWRIINVSHKSIEEIAVEILSWIHLKEREDSGN
ncbi:MAG: pyruvate, water dikinase regulatory protein [Bacteroidales bacterium]